jgi:[glutamine synthetase] adenylyltransferase / [glutamine synthetase]-adenylyl-L-tyrosine phosphorylase
MMMKSVDPLPLQGETGFRTEHRFGFGRPLWPLVDRVLQHFPDGDLAKVTLRMVRERAPDEQLALAFLTKLLDQSPTVTAEILGSSQCESDLIFCLGASELVGSGLVTLGTEWGSAFKEARGSTASELLRTIRFDASGAEDAAHLTQRLAEFKSRVFMTIAIADLLGRLTVSDTVSAMSRLADECIRTALTIGTLSLGGLAKEAGDFCVIAMGKLGAEELNLSSDVDLMYVFGGPDDAEHQDAARRLGEAVTKVLVAHCFRVDLRLRPGGRSSPLVISLEAALRFYETHGQTWERAALLRARPVAGALGLGNQLISELRRFIFRSYLDFDTLRQLRATN